VLPAQAQRFPACGQQLEVAALLQHPAEVGGHVEYLLQVVQDQEEMAFLQVLHQVLHCGSPRCFAYSEDMKNRGDHQVGITCSRQINKRRAVRE
jgi:hypothetical protein